LPLGKLTEVLKVTSSFFCFMFKLKETSMDSSNFVVQFFLTFLIASSITSIFLSFETSKNFLNLLDAFNFINPSPRCPWI
jgi:hypothetical protein